MRLVRESDKPCSARAHAILGFREPTEIPCGLIEGHEGRHYYTISWEDSQ